MSLWASAAPGTGIAGLEEGNKAGREGGMEAAAAPDFPPLQLDCVIFECPIST